MTATLRIAGVDEAGRGPLAGPVVAAAVILPSDHGIEGLTDSKLLAPPVRESLAASIRIRASAWAVARVSPQEIDEINILQATMRAMQCALAALAPAAHSALIDGDRCPELPIPARAVVGGDISEAAISAASILAKVVRDTEMVALDKRFPGYGFASHKGYATPEHRAALERLGPCEIHRHSFAPVRAAVNMAADD